MAKLYRYNINYCNAHFVLLKLSNNLASCIKKKRIQYSIRPHSHDSGTKPEQIVPVQNHYRLTDHTIPVDVSGPFWCCAYTMLL